MFISLIGTWVQNIALSWLVFELTRSAFLLGFVGFLGSIPVFLFSIFGGVLADRANKRNILIFTQVSFMCLAFLLALLTQFKLITPLQIMFIALANGIIMSFDAPARQAIVVEMVGKQQLFNAIALNSVAFNSSRIIGPAIAGLLISAVGMSGCFYLNGLSFCAVIAALFWIKFQGFKQGKSSSAFKDMKDLLVFVRARRLVLALLSMVAAISLFGISYVILMPVFVNDILGAGVRGLGILMSGTGIGALAGALVLARLGDFRYKGKLLIYAGFLFSVSLIVFSLSRNYFFALFSLIFVGSSSVMAISLVNTLLQINVPDKLRGRIMSLFMVTFAGIMPFGNLIAGTLAQTLGVSSALLLSGCICAVLFLTMNIFFAEIKSL
jgi:MFS family permease